MNQHPTSRVEWDQDSREAAGAVHPLDLGLLHSSEDQGGIADFLAVARRHRLGLAAWIGLCLGLATIYLLLTPSEYVATTQVVLESRRPIPGGPEPAPALAVTLDSAQADSQVLVVRSERNLRYVFDTLALGQSPEYGDEPPSLMDRLSATLGFGRRPDTPVQEDRRITAAFQRFSDRVTVRRLAQSYVLEIAFRALSPGDAVKLANAVTAAYIRDQIQFTAASVQRGTQFLQGRIADIQAQQDAATQAVRTGIVPDLQFADADARIVGAAVLPLVKSYPQSKLILVVAALFGLLTWVGFVAMRHSFDRVVRSRRQVERALGVNCLAALPRVRTKGGRVADKGGLSLSAVVDMPHSDFARTMRVLRAALFSAGQQPRHRAIGVVSCLRGEGRSTIAANLAFLLAASAEDTLLIDADMAVPTLSRRLAPDAPAGMSDVLLAPQLLDAEGAHALPQGAIGRNLHFVAAAAGGQAPPANVFLGASEMQAALLAARDGGHVVLDLSPLSLSSDAQAIGHLLDGVALLVEVNRTTLDDVAEAIRALRVADLKLLGVVLNKVPA